MAFLRCSLLICITLYFTQENDIKPLLLTPLIKAGEIEEAQKAALITEIGELKSYRSYSGYLTVNETTHSRLFFWFFYSQGNPAKDPVVLWLQGGPCKSSLVGLFIENGPLDIRDGVLRKRKASFTDHHSVIYLDNPIGVGFSRTDQKSFHGNVSSIAEDLYVAIPQFFALFPNLQKNKFYIAGQTYAQRYIITLIDLILKRGPREKYNFNLAGVAIGNGHSNPYAQSRPSNLAYQTGLINSEQYKELQSIESRLNESEGSGYLDWSGIVKDRVIEYFQESTGYDNVGNFMEAFTDRIEEPHLRRLLNQPKWKKGIHAENFSFTPWSKRAHAALNLDRVTSITPYLTQMIDNFKVLLYNGQLDITIPYRATVDYLRGLPFKGANEYDNVERQIWRVRGKVAGYVTQVGNLIEVLVRNAGRSTPRDQIVWSADMLYRFTRDIPFTAPVTWENATTDCPC